MPPRAANVGPASALPQRQPPSHVPPGGQIVGQKIGQIVGQILGLRQIVGQIVGQKPCPTLAPASASHTRARAPEGRGRADDWLRCARS